MSPRKVIDREICGKHWEAYEDGSVYVVGNIVISANGRIPSGVFYATDIEIALALHKAAPRIEIPNILYEPPSVTPPEGRIWERYGNNIFDWQLVDPTDDDLSESIPYEKEIPIQETLLAASKEIYSRQSNIMTPGQVLAIAHMEKLSSLVLELMCARKDKTKILDLINKINPLWEAFKLSMQDENLDWK